MRKYEHTNARSSDLKVGEVAAASKAYILNKTASVVYHVRQSC